MKHGLFRGNYFINISNLYSKFSAALWQLICGETYFPATYFFCLSPFLLYYICIDTVLVHFSGLIFEWEDFFLDRLIIESYTEESPVVCSRLVKFYILLQFFFFFDEFHLPGNLLWFACLLFCFVSQCKESLFLAAMRQAGSFRYFLSLLFFIKPSFLMKANQF